MPAKGTGIQLTAQHSAGRRAGRHARAHWSCKHGTPQHKTVPARVIESQVEPHGQGLGSCASADGGWQHCGAPTSTAHYQRSGHLQVMHDGWQSPLAVGGYRNGMHSPWRTKQGT